jgi:hypothetical protein
MSGLPEIVGPIERSGIGQVLPDTAIAMSGLPEIVGPIEHSGIGQVLPDTASLCPAYLKS